jgi:FtsZ-interacting cell division protein ZipA
VDKELFRLILLVFGVALVATVYYWERLRGWFGGRPAATGRRPARTAAKPAAAVRDAADEEPFDHELNELEALIRADESVEILLQDPHAPGTPRARKSPAAATAAAPRPVAPPPPRVLAMTLVASGGSISGIRLRRMLTDHGLGLGSRGLFERIGEEGRPLYSAANLVEPGTFDPLTLDGLSTPGLVLFQVLDGDGDHAAVFDAMLETARKLAVRLDCALCDSQRQPLGADAIAALRAEAEAAGNQAEP